MTTRAAGPPTHLRHMLTAGGVLPPRDEELARTGQWLAMLLASIPIPGTGGWSTPTPPGR